MASDRSFDVDSDDYGSAYPDVESSRNSLGKHHRSHILDCLQSQFIVFIPAIQQVSDQSELCVQCTDCLVRMEVGGLDRKHEPVPPVLDHIEEEQS